MTTPLLIAITGQAGTEWMRQAACRDGVDPDIFYPEKENGGSSAAAELVCATCPVAEVCGDWATRTGERFGIWGASTGKDRKQRPDWKPKRPHTRDRTACPQNHPYNEENTYFGADGSRRCRVCKRNRRPSQAAADIEAQLALEEGVA